MLFFINTIVTRLIKIDFSAEMINTDIIWG